MNLGGSQFGHQGHGWLDLCRGLQELLYAEYINYVAHGFKEEFLSWFHDQSLMKY